MEANRQLQVDLLAQHRPRRFGDFVGIDEGVKRARSLATRGGAVVLYGPTGAGKTALAEVIARAFLCDGRHADDSPCGNCASCRGVRDGTLLGGFTRINGPDDGRVQPVSDAVAKAGDGRPNVILIDNADQVSVQTLLLLQPLVDLHSPSTLVIVIVRDADWLLQREPGLAWRYTWIELPQVPTSVVATYLTGIADAHHHALTPSVAMSIAEKAKGSVALGLRLLQGQMVACHGPNVDEPVAPIAQVAERVLEHVLTGDLRKAADSANRRWEAVRSEIETAFGECLAALRDRQPFKGVQDHFAGPCERIAHRQGAAGVMHVEQLIDIWAARVRPLSEAGFVRALSRTERLVAVATLADAEAGPTSLRPLQIRPVGAASLGRYLTSAQFTSLTDHCASAMCESGLTVRIEACLRHDDRRRAAARVSAVTHGLSMFMAKRGETAPMWFYLHHDGHDGPRTTLAIMLKTEQVETVAKWLTERVGGIELRTCRETSDERRIAFQVSVLRAIGAYVDPALGWREADGSVRLLHQFIGLGGNYVRALGPAFTTRTIGTSRRDSAGAPDGGPLGSLVSAFNRDLLVQWRGHQRHRGDTHPTFSV